ncbi:calmodulin-like [Haematococcus lacustris]|uniref:Calmodulin-like n=1 Tax=Haematococcus lacustris TaxID=44745 RepID=A0A699Z447_HAELA|nr:calmodulin-like [Haematococcus lacustris]
MVATLNALSLMVSAYFLITLGPSSGFKSVLVWLPLMILDLGTACYLGYVILPQPHDPYATALMIEMGKPYVADEAQQQALLLASPELRALRSAFDSLDINDSGTITMRELGHHVKHVLGTRASAGELRAMLGEVDADNDGELKFSDFLLFLAFAAFDTNNTGRITSSSLATAVERMGCMDLLHPDIVNAMVRLADADGDGLVGMRQFLRVFDFLGLDHLKLA